MSWIAIPFVWIFILRLGGMRLMILSLPSFVVFSIFVFQYVGFPILYFQLDDYRAEFVTNQDLLLKAWLITSISTILVCFGAVLGAYLLKPLKYFRVKNILHKVLAKYIKRRIYLVGLFCLGVLIVYIAKIGFNNIALVAVLNGAGSSEIALARSLMGNDFGSGYHWYNFFMRDCLVFISLTLIAIRLQKPQEISKVYFILIIAAAVLSLVMATEKGLFVDFLIAVSLVYIISKNKGVVPFSVVLYFIFFSFTALIVFYIYFMGDADIVASVMSIFSRGLTGSLQPIYHYLEFFPTYQNWLYGITFPNPGGIFPFTPYNLTVEVMNFVQPEHRDSGVVGTMPAIYWGELYANFGYLGVFIFSPWVGFFLYYINWIIYRLEFDPMNSALFAWMLVHYKNLSLTSISMFIIDFNLIVILFVYCILKIKIVNKHNKSLVVTV
jgi:oligosaccharide repeat unit polymerase